jgi:hypothetical protein
LNPVAQMIEYVPRPGVPAISLVALILSNSGMTLPTGPVRAGAMAADTLAT